MKTVVTGASGHLGVNLVRTLLSNSREVRILSHKNDIGLEGLPVERFKGDICDIDSLIGAFRDADVVYHLAAHISLLTNDWGICEQLNVKGVRNIVEACRRASVRRLIHLSSIHALNLDPPGITVDESCPLVETLKAPSYDRSKAAGEKVVRQAIEDGLNAVIIRPTSIIGPYDYRPSHFGQGLLLMASGKMPVYMEGGFDWVDVRDIAEYAVKAEQVAAPGSIYMLSGHWISMKELAQTAASLSGTRSPIITCPAGLARLAAPIATLAASLTGTRPIFTDVTIDTLMGNFSVSHSKATRELGYNPRPFRETLADSIKWFRDNGFLKKDGRRGI